MPKRLLDIGQLGEPVIRLLETSKATREAFAIASYAWGSGSQAGAIERAKTTKENVDSRIGYGMEVISLPKTIQDLIEVTRQIGHRYLWLDAFCIVQDDKAEKSHQLELMVEFYKQADILISAASASNCDEGFLQPRSVDQSYGSIFQLPCSWKHHDQVTQGSVLFCEKDLNCATDKDPVHMRIWTFQEHLVSSRVISFGSRQVKWSCQKVQNVVDGGKYHESVDGLQDSLEKAFSPSQYSSENSVEKNWRVWAWMVVVEEYSNRDYSHPRDRVPAFNEAISLLAPKMGWDTSECVEGIWKSDAARQLLWKKAKPLATQVLGESANSETAEQPGPSWSWATLPGGVIYDSSSLYRDLGDSNPTIEFQETIGQPKCLTIMGHILEADWRRNYPNKISAEETRLFEVEMDVEMQPQPG
ncbi:hypothetical protein NW762_013388 [Fusarium torreyae]|uniref:Heterokaryon incompatibility domain-containing protein n=1 Tax=Fusarium torreyae TaxID=1237075 RepID=A0A9W8V7S3_9HYPO|nr:hypothetical protein NW762_013388 [Fusarium torreyae]